MAASTLEEAFVKLVEEAGIEQPQREYRINVNRQYRFDFAWPRQRVAVELEGGVWSGGRHTRGTGFVADCRKYNFAVSAGWLVLRYTRADMHEDERDEVKYEVGTLLKAREPMESGHFGASKSMRDWYENENRRRQEDVRRIRADR